MGAGPTRQMKGAGNNGETPVMFKMSDAERIANVVNTIEGSRRPPSPSRLPRGVTSGSPARVGTFTGTWAIGETHVVSLAVNTAFKVTATNAFVGMSSTTSIRCSVVREGTTWYCVSADLTQQPGYSSSGTKVLTVSGGVLVWVGTTACS
jgi:hypothetical protein